jgi:hypothetical protein
MDERQRAAKGAISRAWRVGNRRCRELLAGVGSSSMETGRPDAPKHGE